MNGSRLINRALNAERRRRLPFCGHLLDYRGLSSTVADLTGMDATPMSKLESKATDVILKIFICSF